MPEAAQSTQPTSSGAQPGTFIDPYRAYNFKLQIQGVTEGHFTQCSGLEIEVQPIRYREGGATQVVHVIPGPVTYGDVTLSYGLTSSIELWQWLTSAVQGNVQRRNVSVLMLDSTGSDGGHALGSHQRLADTLARRTARRPQPGDRNRVADTRLRDAATRIGSCRPGEISCARSSGSVVRCSGSSWVPAEAGEACAFTTTRCQARRRTGSSASSRERRASSSHPPGSSAETPRPALAAPVERPAAAVRTEQH